MYPLRCPSGLCILSVLLAIAMPVESTVGQESSRAAQGVLVAGGLVFLGSMIYDVATAPSSARMTNQELSFGPAIDPVNRKVGVRLSLPVGPAPQMEERNPGTALVYSLTGSLVPLSMVALLPAVGEGNRIWLGALTGVGLVIGPSTGHWYAGQPSRANRGLLIRVFTIVVGVAAAGAAIVD